MPPLPVMSRWCSRPGTSSPARGPEGPSPWTRAFARVRRIWMLFAPAFTFARRRSTSGRLLFPPSLRTARHLLDGFCSLSFDSQAHPRAAVLVPPHEGIEQERAPEDTPRPGASTRGSIRFRGWLAPRRSDPDTLRRPPAPMLDGKPDTGPFRRAQAPRPRALREEGHVCSGPSAFHQQPNRVGSLTLPTPGQPYARHFFPCFGVAFW